MPCYIDSSFILSILFEQNAWRDAVKLWKKSSVRLSSLVCEAECIINLRKVGEQNKAAVDDEWVLHKENELRYLLKEINTMRFDATVLQNIQANQSLRRLRTLDAIHLATALEFQKYSDEIISLFTFDKNMSKEGESLGFQIFPKN